MENWIETKIEGYFVSDKGNVKSIKKGKEILLKQMVTKTGYLYVNLYYESRKYKSFKVHKLVADAFIPNKDNKECIDNIDGNKQNNNVNNLRWSTQKENMNNPITRSRCKESKKGECKPVAQYNLEGKFIRRYDSIKDAARETSLRHSSISQCCSGKMKKVGMFVFKYLDLS